MSESITSQLAAGALDLESEAIPDSVFQTAKASILDTLACAVAAREERVARSLRAWAREEGSRGVATMWGSSEKVSAAHAALVNGTAAHALDFDDVSWGIQGHPSVPLLPAAFAVAESRGRSGAELLAAYVAGFEVQSRLGTALSRSHYERGWHPTSTVGVFGATAAAGRLLGLDAEALEVAFGIAVSSASGTRANFGTDTKPLHAGQAARSGVVSAELARRGVTARRDALECEMGFADLYDGVRELDAGPFGRPFALEDPGVELKPYPSCRFTHRIIDAVLELRERHGVAVVESMHLRVDPFALDVLIHPEPTTGLEAKFSMPFCAAAAWLEGWPTLGTFDDARVDSIETRALMSRITVTPDTAASEEVEIRLADGTRDSARVQWAKGGPKNPLSHEERLRKVRGCVSLVLGADRGEALVKAVDKLESLERAADLARLCEPI